MLVSVVVIVLMLLFGDRDGSVGGRNGSIVVNFHVDRKSVV